MLLIAMVQSHATGDETIYRGMGDSASQFPTLKRMLTQGMIAKKPDISRYDYNDVYRVKKPFTFLGQTTVLVSDEYMSEYVGCCVSEGWGAVFARKGDLKPLQKFAQQNQCSLSEMDKESTDYYRFNLKKLPQANYYALSCRERDLDQQE